MGWSPQGDLWRWHPKSPSSLGERVERVERVAGCE